MAAPIFVLCTLKTKSTEPTEADQTLYGSYDGEALAGSGGNDTLYAGDANDTLTGGAGNDQLEGGRGRDTTGDQHTITDAARGLSWVGHRGT